MLVRTLVKGCHLERMCPCGMCRLEKRGERELFGGIYVVIHCAVR